MLRTHDTALREVGPRDGRRGPRAGRRATGCASASASRPGAAVVPGSQLEPAGASLAGRGAGVGGSAASPAPFGVCSGVENPCTTLIHEHKSSSADKTRTYDVVRILPEPTDGGGEQGPNNAGTDIGLSAGRELAAESNRLGGDEFPARLDRFARGRAGNDELAAFLVEQRSSEFGAGKRAKKLRDCATWLHFRHYPTIDLVRLHGGRFCQQAKLCANCARRRGAKLMRRYVERITTIHSERPDLQLYFLTVTCKGREDLRSMHDHLWGNFTRWLANRRRHEHGQAYTVLSEFAGGVAAAEVKRGSGSGLWHEHLHIAVLCERLHSMTVRAFQEDLSDEWRALTGDSFVVDLRPFHYVRACLPATVDNLCCDLVEVFKYCVKLNDLAHADRWHAHQQLHGAHMLRAFGCLFGVEVPADLLDDPITAEDLPFIEWFYRYRDGRYQLEDGGQEDETCS